MFTKETLNKLKEKVKILDLLKDLEIEYIQNKDSYGQCPFCRHFESFAISDIHEKYCCFHCNAQGDSISLLMIHNRMSFDDAVLYLASFYNIRVEIACPKEKKKKLTDEEVLKAVLEVIQERKAKEENYPEGLSPFLNSISFLDNSGNFK